MKLSGYTPSCYIHPSSSRFIQYRVMVTQVVRVTVQLGSHTRILQNDGELQCGLY